MIKHKKQQKRKLQGRPKRRPNTVTVINRSPTPFPTRILTKLLYADEIDRTLIGSFTNIYTFNANSIFDPDQTGVGHQPLAYDQFTPDYNRYRVLKVHYDITFGNTSTVGQATRCVVAFVNGSTVPSFPAIFEIRNGTNGTVGTGGDPLRLKGSFDLTKINADPQKYRIDDRYSAVVTGNPTEVMYIHCAMYSTSGSPIRLGVRLTYDVEFYDVETPSSSSAIIRRLTDMEELKQAYFEAKAKRLVKRNSQLL
jgi:hypothetical protein